jgi:hypothetical protein
MDYFIYNIKTFVCLVTAPKRHTAHKTMRIPCVKRGQALHLTGKPPPMQSLILGGLLNVHLMAVDFTKHSKIDRHFLFITTHLSAWQCYIAKYP